MTALLGVSSRAEAQMPAAPATAAVEPEDMRAVATYVKALADKKKPT